MKRNLIKYLLVSLIPILGLTGCYTQIATRDDSFPTYSSNNNTTDNEYNYGNDDEYVENGYFDESDTLDNPYGTLENDEAINDSNEAFNDNDIIINNYYGYDPYYYDFYPSYSIFFWHGYWYPRHYYPWYVDWYYPYYYYPGYCLYPAYGYDPFYSPYYFYNYGYYDGHYWGNNPSYYRTRPDYVSRIRNTGSRSFGNTRRDVVRNTNLISKTNEPTRNIGVDRTRSGIDKTNLGKRDKKSVTTTRNTNTRDKSNFTQRIRERNNKETKRTLGSKNTEQIKKFRTNSGVRNNTTNRNRNINRPPQRYNTPNRNNTTTKTYSPPKHKTETRSYNPPKNRGNNTPRTYSPPRNNTPRTTSPPRTTTPPRTTSRGSNNNGNRHRR